MELGMRCTACHPDEVTTVHVSVLSIRRAVDLGAVGAQRLWGLCLLVRHADFADLCSSGPRSLKTLWSSGRTSAHERNILNDKLSDDA